MDSTGGKSLRPPFSGSGIRAKLTTSPEKLQVLWSWNKNGAWVAAAYPRWTFAGTPVLYKLYISQAIVPRENGPGGETSEEFLQAFLPEIDKLLAQKR